MLKLVFITSDWNHEVVQSFSRGIKRFLEKNECVKVCMVSSVGGYSVREIENIGQFDGIVLQGNQEWASGSRQAFARAAVKREVPVVSINYPLEGCTYVGTDNEGAMRKACLHVIEDHGATRLAFVRGLSTSKEARARERAFWSVCRERGMDLDAIRAVGGDSWTEEEGARAAAELLSESDPLPEAILCANDTLAIGVISTLQNAGLRVPEDVIVTGFDNLSIAQTFEPRITSIDRGYERIAEIALETLLGRIRGTIDPKERVVSPSKLVNSTSCGCHGPQISELSLKGDYHALQKSVKDCFHTQVELESSLLGAKTFPKIMDVFERFSAMLSSDRFYIVLHGSYLLDLGLTSEPNKSVVVAARDARAELAPPNEAHVYATFTRDRVVPGDVLADRRFAVVYPLHSGMNDMGYVVLEDVGTIMEMYFAQGALVLIENNLENVRQQHLLRNLYERLDDLYVRDQLTGLYNRFGLERIGTRMFERLTFHHHDVAIAFIDIDDMKAINDAYGHEAGDKAIVEVADAVKTICDKLDLFGMRYGGDEFLVIGEEAQSDAILELEHDVARANANSEDEFTLSISIGLTRVKWDSKLSLSEYIQRADSEMYALKRRKKRVEETS
ncbi:MAG: GGDEF domain-containing protein [Olsenella sp.]|nr:GGDEF domain-containing protein [Olsenella sp.]